MSAPRIIVALDFPSQVDALDFADRLVPTQCRVKVGLELFTAAGPQIVEALRQRGFEVFLDLKFHDIPNTVAQACRSAADLGVWMLNVHTLGGPRMLSAAREAIAAAHGTRPLLTGVTILTSHDDAELVDIGLAEDAAHNVTRLASQAQATGLDGVVCSANEAAMLRDSLGPEFVLVTPGIRPQGAAVGDQRRVTTAGAAVAAGAHYLVVGRPITQADEPMTALAALRAEIGED